VNEGAECTIKFSDIQIIGKALIKTSKAEMLFVRVSEDTRFMLRV
jgi:hypothetical protein